jgi:DNA repair protein RecO (recombination protein O)
MDFGEADRLLTIFTPEMGKLRVLAKGARKTGSRKAGHVELFCHTQLQLAKGKTFDIVSQAESIEPFRALRENLEAASLAYYAVELLLRFTEEEDPNPPLFDLLRDTLGRLGSEAEGGLVLRYYELHLLNLVGYRPQLHYCLLCKKALLETTNYLSLEDGGMLCPEDAMARPQSIPMEAAVLKVLRFLQTKDWEACVGLRLKNETALDAENYVRQYLTYLLERRLKSVDFMMMLRRQRNAGGV